MGENIQISFWSMGIFLIIEICIANLNSMMILRLMEKFSLNLMEDIYVISEISTGN